MESTSEASPPAGAKTAERTLRKSPFGAPHVFVLAVIDGGDTDAVFRIVRPETVIGRGEESGIRLDDEQVSKAHCKIRIEGPVCTIVDLGSLNGTRVNGRRLNRKTAQRLRNLDELEVGGHRMLLLVGRFRQPG